jgi:hypothetical protein
LGIPAGHAVLHHQTWVYDQEDHVIEYAEKVSAMAVYEYRFPGARSTGALPDAPDRTVGMIGHDAAGGSARVR